MSFPSKYKGKCKDCGKEHKAGENISKNTNGNWCVNGANCQACMQTTGPQTVTNWENKVADIKPINSALKQFTIDEAEKLLTIERQVRESLGIDPNVQKVGMYVKEIYRTWTNKESTS